MPFCYHSSLLNGQVKFFPGKYVIWIYLLTADDLEKKNQYGSLLPFPISLRKRLIFGT